MYFAVLIADCIIAEAVPSKPGDFGGGISFEDSLKSIENDAVSRNAHSSKVQTARADSGCFPLLRIRPEALQPNARTLSNPAKLRLRNEGREPA